MLPLRTDQSLGGGTKKIQIAFHLSETVNLDLLLHRRRVRYSTSSDDTGNYCWLKIRIRSWTGYVPDG